ncbi:ATP-binding cassette domain-containing protein, partial [candidate division KSB1 bacterium]
MIHLVNITQVFGDRAVLNNVSWHISPNDRIGLIGPNGAGKTTVFKIITGELNADSGDIHKKNNIEIGYLPQELQLSSVNSVLDESMSSFRFADDLEKRLKDIEGELVKTSDDKVYREHLVKKLEKLKIKIDEISLEKEKFRALKILSGLGFKESEVSLPVNTFSKGWQMKIAIARLLMMDNDILLLDEPTNHLDLDSIEWLEKYLKNFSGAVIIISHDKYFLNNLTDKLIEINEGDLTVFNGDYAFYLEKKNQLISDQRKKYDIQQKEIERIKRFIDRNRVRKDRAKMVQSRLKYLKKLERLEAPSINDNVRFSFPESRKSGRIVFELKNLTFNFENKQVLENIDINIENCEKIAVLGSNGAGKTTLLKILSGSLIPASGLVNRGYNVDQLNFIDEDISEIKSSNTVFEEMEQNSSVSDFPYIRNILAAFLFKGDDVFKKVNILSGGEKCRLALAKMMVKPSNFLVLDEPTSHIDANTQLILENAVNNYNGTVVFVSHDRAFIDSIATKVVEIINGHLNIYYGNYSYYLDKKGQKELQLPVQTENKKKEKKIDPGKSKKRAAEIILESSRKAA